MTIRLATRGSLLARTQSGHVADALRELSGQDVEVVLVKSHGDADQSTPLASFGGVGVFVAAVREAVLRGDADIAVHSLKDLPTEPAAGLEIAAIPQRQDGCADLHTFVPGRRVDDHLQVMLRYAPAPGAASGARGLLWASQVACGEENHLRIRLYGTRAALHWDQEQPNELIFHPAGEPARRLKIGRAHV